MCMETMDFKSTYLNPGEQRKITKSGTKPHLRLFDEAAAALERGRRGDAIKLTVRKYLRLEQRRIQIAKDLADCGAPARRTTAKARRKTAASFTSQAPGAMAPRNTTQYLMGNVYADMTDDAELTHTPVAFQYGQSPSPTRVYAALDADYESFLSYQQRDFEEAFPLGWEPC